MYSACLIILFSKSIPIPCSCIVFFRNWFLRQLSSTGMWYVPVSFVIISRNSFFSFSWEIIVCFSFSPRLKHYRQKGPENCFFVSVFSYFPLGHCALIRRYWSSKGLLGHPGNPLLPWKLVLRVLFISLRYFPYFLFLFVH